MKRTLFAALLVGASLFLVQACSSVPDPASIPADMPIVVLTQNAQNAFDRNNYKAAEVYYQLIIDRYGSDPAVLTAAEFEIAHLRIKEKKWDDARPRLEAIVARYEGAGGASLPPEYLKLAKIDLAKIPQGK
jgi:outer membrane protein assembly factor BamD (BamD/ComL family)